MFIASRRSVLQRAGVLAAAALTRESLAQEAPPLGANIQTTCELYSGPELENALAGAVSFSAGANPRFSHIAIVAADCSWCRRALVQSRRFFAFAEFRYFLTTMHEENVYLSAPVLSRLAETRNQAGVAPFPSVQLEAMLFYPNDARAVTDDVRQIAKRQRDAVARKDSLLPATCEKGFPEILRPERYPAKVVYHRAAGFSPWNTQEDINRSTFKRSSLLNNVEQDMDYDRVGMRAIARVLGYKPSNQRGWFIFPRPLRLDNLPAVRVGGNDRRHHASQSSYLRFTKSPPTEPLRNIYVIFDPNDVNSRKLWYRTELFYYHAAFHWIPLWDPEDATSIALATLFRRMAPKGNSADRPSIWKQTKEIDVEDEFLWSMLGYAKLEGTQAPSQDERSMNASLLELVSEVAQRLDVSPLSVLPLIVWQTQNGTTMGSMGLSLSVELFEIVASAQLS